jgi:hypothetical protein
MTAHVPAPGFRTTTQRRWLLSVGMAVALLQGAIFAIVDPDLAGWHPYHGHMAIGGVVAEHTHPWENAHREHGPWGEDDQAMTFTGSSLGQIGSVAGLALPGVAFLTLLGLAALMMPPARSSHLPRTLALNVPVPPPRS